MKKINLRRWLRYKYCNFVRIKDHPGSIATGAALGISFDVLPTFGLGVIFAYFLASVLRVNRVSTIISAVVFKLCIPLFAYLNLLTGSLVMDEPMQKTAVGSNQNWLHYDWSTVGASFLVGSVINATLIYVLAYVITYYFVIWRRKRIAYRKNRTDKRGPVKL